MYYRKKGEIKLKETIKSIIAIVILFLIILTFKTSKVEPSSFSMLFKSITDNSEMTESIDDIDTEPFIISNIIKEIVEGLK